jgi:hypothetical protein
MLHENRRNGTVTVIFPSNGKLHRGLIQKQPFVSAFEPIAPLETQVSPDLSQHTEAQAALGETVLSSSNPTPVVSETEEVKHG